MDWERMGCPREDAAPRLRGEQSTDLAAALLRERIERMGVRIERLFTFNCLIIAPSQSKLLPPEELLIEDLCGVQGLPCSLEWSYLFRFYLTL